MTPALEFLHRHIPAPMWSAMEERWRLPAPLALTLGGEEALLDLSTALESILPRVTGVTFSALPSSQRRVPRDEGRALASHEMMTLEELEGAWAAIKRRAIGSLGGVGEFRSQVGRLGGPEEKRRVKERHLGPGGYELEEAYRAIEPEVGVRAFDKYLGRPPTIEEGGEGEGEGEGGEGGEREDLNPQEAKDLLLPRRGGGVLAFDLAPSRSQDDKRLPDSFGALTRDLDYGDSEIDQVTLDLS